MMAMTALGMFYLQQLDRHDSCTWRMALLDGAQQLHDLGRHCQNPTGLRHKENIERKNKRNNKGIYGSNRRKMDYLTRNSSQLMSSPVGLHYSKIRSLGKVTRLFFLA
jgi:hypothetical protein